MVGDESINRRCLCGVQLVRLTFTKLDVELSEDCVYDHLSVYDGADDQRTSTIGVYCGHATPQELIQSTNNTILITFTSDELDAGQGFVVSWLAVDSAGQLRRQCCDLSVRPSVCAVR